MRPVQFVVDAETLRGSSPPDRDAYLVLREDVEGVEIRSKALVRRIAERVNVPAGLWHWVIVGDQWIAEGLEQLWPAPPEAGPTLVRIEPQRGCPLRLADSEAWFQVEEVGILSSRLRREALLPRELLSRIVVPEGASAVLFYGRERHLLGVGLDLECRPGDVLEMSPPFPLAADRQQIVLRMTFSSPPGPGLRLEAEARVAADPVAARGAAPRQWVRMAREVVALFAPLPALPLAVRVSGEATRSEEALLHAEAGSVRTIAMTMRPRRTLRTEVDLRLVSPGRAATLHLWRCADRVLGGMALARRWGQGRCIHESERRLEQGWQTHEFHGLDSGTYVLTLESSGDTVLGWDYGLEPILDPAADDFGPVPPWRIEEYLIEGELRFDGRAAVGELVAQAGVRGKTEVFRFPTDEYGRFRMTYLGRPLDPADQPPNGLRELLEAVPSAKRLGVPRSWRIRARVDGVGWFPIANESLFVGGGELELSLASGVAVRVAVRDRMTGEPLPGARVLLSGRPGLLFFYGGHVERLAQYGSFDLFVTDESGRLDVILPRLPWLALTAGAEGYRADRRELSTEELAGPLDLELALDTWEVVPPGSVRLTVQETPLPEAAVLALDVIEGSLRLHCWQRADPEGWVAPPDEDCDPWQAEAVIVAHPAARLLAQPNEISGTPRSHEAERAPERPLVVRLVDAEGTCLEGRQLALAVSGLRLDRELREILADVVSLPELVSDASGEIALPPCFAWEDLEWAIPLDVEGDEGELDFRPLPRPLGGVVEILAE